MTTPDFVDSDKKIKARKPSEKPDLAQVLKDALEHPDEPPLSGGSKYARLKNEVEERTAVLQDQAEQAFFERMTKVPVKPKKPSRFLGVLQLLHEPGAFFFFLVYELLLFTSFSLQTFLFFGGALAVLFVGGWILAQVYEKRVCPYVSFQLVRQRDVRIEKDVLYELCDAEGRCIEVSAPQSGTYYAEDLTSPIPQKVDSRVIMHLSGSRDAFGRFPVYCLTVECLLPEGQQASSAVRPQIEALIKARASEAMEMLNLLAGQKSPVEKSVVDEKVCEPLARKLEEHALVAQAFVYFYAG